MNQPEVVVMGLGYIGLPTATLIASQKVKVLGVDIDRKKVNTINQGKSHFFEKGLDKTLLNAVQKGFLRAAVKPTPANTYIIVVPTPFKNKNEPDISFVESATRMILPLLKEEDLYIIESTSPIGTTEKIMSLIFRERPELEDKIYITYCPERVLPGDIMRELVNNDRVIGGVNEISTKKAKKFYSKYIKGDIHTTNSRTAEMCKLVENSSRDNQIAFANELSLISEKANINVWELIQLANKHPRVNILQPGCGVGGHCIAVDPYFIVSEYPMETKIMGIAREVNNYKSFWCAEQIQNKKRAFELKYGKKPKTALMGLSFKPNIDDLRESPAKYIVQKVLQGSNNEIHFIVEPNIKTHNVFKLTKYEEAIKESDIIVFLVAHKEFKHVIIEKNKEIIDFCGVTQKNNF